MGTFNSIVVAIDFSESARAAFATASALAASLGASLRAVHVVPQNALRTCVREGLLDPGDSDEAIRQKANAFVGKQFDAFFADGGGDAERVVLFGDPAHALVDYVREGTDMVVVGRRGASLADVLLGSVAERVVRHAACPVLIVKRR